MNAKSFQAFGDELTKIAFFQALGEGLKDATRLGWQGTKADPQRFMGAGKLTKYLPIGGKSLMLAGTAAMVPGAISSVDPMGQDRSRTERVSGLAANTFGGLAGAGAMMKTQFGKRHPIIGGMIGGIGGGIGAEKLVTSPWRRRRMNQMALQNAEQRQQMAPQPQQQYGEVAQ